MISRYQMSVTLAGAAIRKICLLSLAPPPPPSVSLLLAEARDGRRLREHAPVGGRQIRLRLHSLIPQRLCIGTERSKLVSMPLYRQDVGPSSL